MRTQYIISISSKLEREEFYDYIVNNYNLIIEYPYKRIEFINSSFPFVVDFKENNFWIVNSITCCACAASKGLIINQEEFKRKVKELKL